MYRKLACANLGIMLTMEFEISVELVEDLWRGCAAVVPCSWHDHVKWNGVELLHDPGVGAVMLKTTPEGIVWSDLMQAL